MSEQPTKPRESKDIESYSKIILAFVAVLGFLWGVFQYIDGQSKQAESRRIEATRPYLERQLELYTEATQLAARIAMQQERPESGRSETLVSPDPTADLRTRDPVARFWELYWGELALVEDGRVQAAMVEYGKALGAGGERARLKNLSLELAHACRDSLAESWGVEEWRRPTSGSN